MMQVAMSRLCEMWPNAHMQVLTNHPELLPCYSPKVVPVANTGRLLWLAKNSTSSHSARWQSELRRSWTHSFSGCRPAISPLLRRLRHPFRDAQEQKSIEQFLNVMCEANLFVVTGMGGLTSAFREYSVMVLDTLALAQAYKVPTVLFGQGIGPFDQELEKRTCEVLRQVDYLALREGLHGPKLLKDWGIPNERWSITGDDAIELALQNRREAIGEAIGVNVRVAEYSDVTEKAAGAIRVPLQEVATTLRAPVRAIPISRLPDEDDNRRVERLFSTCAIVEHSVNSIDTPLAVVEEIQKCRVVVTGSYHAGVFALSQGIPVIGLAASEYYHWKFEGLVHQFGNGCGIIRLKESGSGAALQQMVYHLWHAAPDLRPDLLRSAEQQSQASRATYEHVHSLIKQGAR